MRKPKALRVKRNLTGAEIIGPRWRCWRCQGRRMVAVYVGNRLTTKPCPSCNFTDPGTASVHDLLEEAA